MQSDKGRQVFIIYNFFEKKKEQVLDLSTPNSNACITRHSTSPWPICLRTVLQIEMYFCKGYDYGETVDLTKGYCNPKRKMWVSTHFSEIIKQP